MSNKIKKNKPEIKSFLEIISSRNDIFKIPNFQRTYTWDERKTESFLNELLSFTKDRNMFCGIFIFRRRGTTKSFLEVIDGQQRLTTLLLIYKIATFFSNLTSTSDDVKKHLDNQYFFIKNNENDIKTKLNSEKQQNVLEDIFEETEIQKIKDKTKNTELNEFEKRLYLNSKKIHDILSKEVNMNKLINSFDRCFVIYYGSKDEEFSPFEVFESINAQGIPLSPDDLIRNLFYKNLDFLYGTKASDVKEKVETTIKKIFQNIEDMQTKQKGSGYEFGFEKVGNTFFRHYFFSKFKGSNAIITYANPTVLYRKFLKQFSSEEYFKNKTNYKKMLKNIIDFQEELKNLTNQKYFNTISYSRLKVMLSTVSAKTIAFIANSLEKYFYDLKSAIKNDDDTLIIKIKKEGDILIKNIYTYLINLMYQRVNLDSLSKFAAYEIKKYDYQEISKFLSTQKLANILWKGKNSETKYIESLNIQKKIIINNNFNFLKNDLTSESAFKKMVLFEYCWKNGVINKKISSSISKYNIEHIESLSTFETNNNEEVWNIKNMIMLEKNINDHVKDEKNVAIKISGVKRKGKKLGYTNSVLLTSKYIKQLSKKYK